MYAPGPQLASHALALFAEATPQRLNKAERAVPHMQQSMVCPPPGGLPPTPPCLAASGLWLSQAVMLMLRTLMQCTKSHASIKRDREQSQHP
eukprot:362745-Chlamydomonas_euryale.AAC.4